jgi:transposase
MIAVPSGVRVWLATGHTDMRKGFDGLALMVQEKLKHDPHGGHLFVFRGRRGSLIKVLWHDGQGMCLFAKRLERGRFIWPSPADGVVTISPAQLGYLLEGIDWRMPQRTWRPQAAGCGSIFLRRARWRFTSKAVCDSVCAWQLLLIRSRPISPPRTRSSWRSA